jgi:hypothetical protein
MTKELNDSMSQSQAAEQGIKTFSIVDISYADRIRNMSLPISGTIVNAVI